MIEGGSELYGVRKNYVYRASHNGYWVPGKFHSNTCYYGYSGGKNTKTNYELTEAMEPLVWKDKSQVPSNKKIEGGIN